MLLKINKTCLWKTISLLEIWSREYKILRWQQIKIQTNDSGGNDMGPQRMRQYRAGHCWTNRKWSTWHQTTNGTWQMDLTQGIAQPPTNSLQFFSKYCCFASKFCFWISPIVLLFACLEINTIIGTILREGICNGGDAWRADDNWASGAFRW